MRVGSRIVAPEGFGQMPKDVFYHCLDNNMKRPNVLLVFFAWKGKGQPKGMLFKMPREDFEAAIDEGRIVATEEQPTLPPWLQELEGNNLWSRDAARRTAKIPYYDRITKRLATLSPALDSLTEILDADDIAGRISAIARSLTPPQNETRYRLWLLSYLCFGRNAWALLAPFHRIGYWDREVSTTRKLGAPSKAYGRDYGHQMTQSIGERCVKAYIRYVKPGRKITDIYAEAMNREFGCEASPTGKFGLEVYVQPDGLPFPTDRQFRYQIEKALGIETIQMNRYGETRHRNQKAVPEGRYSEAVANLMEKIECDGYFTVELPKGYVDENTLPPLCVVKGRDILSGLEVGIGFSLGSEVGSAYRMMLFSMAVPKDYFAMLWGMEGISIEQWPCEGLSQDIKVDRGPGSSLKLVEDSVKPVFGAMAPSYTPQSKATVESSHPRQIHMTGPPAHFASNQTPVELAKREIRALVHRNNTNDMSDRMELDPALASVPPSSTAIWRHYDGRFRNVATPMSIDEAVRAFLTPIDIKVTKAGAYLDQRWYYSQELQECGLLQHLARGNQHTVYCKGYMLDMCLRHIWIELPSGQLILLKGRLKTREDELLLDVSSTEHQQWKEAHSIADSAYAVHRAAFTSKTMAQHEAETGKSWDAGEFRIGKPKRGAMARQEAREAKQHSSHS